MRVQNDRDMTQRISDCPTILFVHVSIFIIPSYLQFLLDATNLTPLDWTFVRVTNRFRCYGYAARGQKRCSSDAKYNIAIRMPYSGRPQRAGEGTHLCSWVRFEPKYIFGRKLMRSLSLSLSLSLFHIHVFTLIWHDRRKQQNGKTM